MQDAQTIQCEGVPRSFLLKPNSNVILSAELKVPVSRDNVLRAIKYAYSLHPLLSAGIELDREGRVFYETAKYGAPLVILADEEDLRARVVEEFQKPVNPFIEPLCRFHLICREDKCRVIQVTCHHMICDGISLLNLYRDIANALNENNTLEPYSPLIMNQSVIPFPVVGKLATKMIGKRSAPWESKNMDRDSRTLKGIIDIFLDKQIPSIDLLTLEEPVTRKIIERCKAEHVTVNSFILTLLLFSESASLIEQKYRSSTTIAVNLRDKLTENVTNQVGYFASAIRLKNKYAPKKDFWANAKRLDGAVKKELNSKGIFLSQAISLFHPNYIDAIDLNKAGLRKDPDIRKVIKMKGLDRLSTSFVLSNLGKADWANQGKTYSSIVGPFVQTDVSEKYIGVTTIDGKLHIAFSFGKNLIPQHRMEKLIKNMRNNINQIL